MREYARRREEVCGREERKYEGVCGRGEMSLNFVNYKSNKNS